MICTLMDRGCPGLRCLMILVGRFRYCPLSQLSTDISLAGILLSRRDDSVGFMVSIVFGIGGLTNGITGIAGGAWITVGGDDCVTVDGWVDGIGARFNFGGDGSVFRGCADFRRDGSLVGDNNVVFILVAGITEVKP